MRTFKGAVVYKGRAAGTVAKTRVVAESDSGDRAEFTLDDALASKLDRGDEVEVSDDNRVRARVVRQYAIPPGEEGNEAGTDPKEVTRADDLDFEISEVKADWPMPAPSPEAPPQ